MSDSRRWEDTGRVPGAIRLTDSQRQAVTAGGKPVLVSAAAGSGKTRVLTERLMARVLAGEDIDRFLVITFTRAAAAELRGRILSELNARLAADPRDRHLKRQSALLYRAKIGTIDSFCTDLVRENAHAAGVSPGFTVLDEERAQAIRARALEDVLDRAYETVGQDDNLRALVDSVGAGRDDSRLAELILDLDRQMSSRPFPEKWAAGALDMLDAPYADAAASPWGKSLLEDAAEEALYQAERLDEALALMARPGCERMMAAYGQAFSEQGLQFRDVARAAGESWDKTREALERKIPGRKPLRGFDDEALKERIERIWKGAGDGLKRLRQTVTGAGAAQLAAAAASKGPLTALMELVFRLEREYGARKRRADLCDFGDVEHLCVEMLCDGDGGPTALAEAVSDRYAEVMVDEYQDVNAVQELIFRRVSHEGRTLFVVGDVKQSVYRFRLAEPAIFIRRYDAFADGAAGERVLLRENFRSRRCVLEACNGVFGRIMSRRLGDVEYNDEARLIPGNEDYPPEGEVRPELCVLDAAGEEGEETPDKTLLEARYVAGRIRAMVDGGERVQDSQGGTRPVRYGDIALLLRAPATVGAAYRRALAEAGVPVSARQGGAFFSRPEVSFAISLLAVVDNPRQDVPLIAALRGAPFGFSPDELSAVRTAGPGDLWDALCLRAQTDRRCRRFTDLVAELRSYAREEATDSLLRRLYDRTGLITICELMSDGSRRIADLMQLYEYARRFEQDGGRGLFRFVGWLRELERRGMEPPGSDAGDAVRLMSVHKSKGLEFPVVFLADNGHGWNRGQSGHVLCHERLGLGMRMTDTVRGVRWSTLPWRAIRRREQREDLSEQERLLYVAMTRARERLIMTCVLPKAAERLASAGPASDGPISPRELLRAKNTADWLLLAGAADGGRTIDMKLAAPARPEQTAPVRPETIPPADPDLTDRLAARLAWRYPYGAAVALPSKLTATAAGEMAPGDGDPEAAPLPGSHGGGSLRRPDFGRADRPLTGAERGVAAHLVMQHIDLANAGSEEAVAAEIARLARMGYLDARQAAAVDPGDILAFFRSELGARVLAAEKVIREFRFSLLCPAGLWAPDAPEGEQILLQGVVDCCIQEAGALTVIDFKTDAELVPERHAAQLRAYAAAMERIWQMPVRQAALWYLRLRRAADIPLEKTGG